MFELNFLIIVSGLVYCRGIESPTTEPVTPSPENRIVGGEPASSSSNNACIQPEKALSSYVCGGTIISEKNILTACHCVTLNSLFIAVVSRIGSLSCNSGGDTYLSIPTGMVCHPCYNAGSADNDLAVITTIGNMNLNKYSICPMQLALPGQEVPAGTPVGASGWGALSYQGALSFDALQTVYTVIVDPQLCAQLYKGTTIVINDDKICAGNTQTGGKDTCQGDSGGGLIEQSSGRQVGITSVGVGCADTKYPGVYTKVSKHICWIQKAMSCFPCIPLLGCCNLKC